MQLIVICLNCHKNFPYLAYSLGNLNQLVYFEILKYSLWKYCPEEIHVYIYIKNKSFY